MLVGYSIALLVGNQEAQDTLEGDQCRKSSDQSLDILRF